jgi:hypothetical protein
MSTMVVLGGGVGGLSAAFELQDPLSDRPPGLPWGQNMLARFKPGNHL